jgi:two-component system, OmpR family, sensor kinase
VLFILGENACRYSKPGGRIGVALWVENEQANFSLSDQGIGIPAKDIERIFDRNFRSQNAQHSRDDGSGLGLAMAKSIMNAHGGRIMVASTENLGSTFTVTLPLISAEKDESLTHDNLSSII